MLRQRSSTVPSLSSRYLRAGQETREEGRIQAVSSVACQYLPGFPKSKT